MGFVLTNLLRDAALDGVGTLITKAGVYGPPDEITGIRTQIGTDIALTWDSASGGTMTMATTELVFDISEGDSVSAVILKDASGTEALYFTLEQQYTFQSDGTFAASEITLTVN